MRILFISTFFPPYLIGGWEQLVEDLRERLEQRGHTTAVLCSNYGVTNHESVEKDVYRQLLLESNLHYYAPWDYFTRSRQRQRLNADCLRLVTKHFAPDVVFIHGMWNLSHSIPWLAEQLYPDRVVYYIADDWPYAKDLHTAYWETPTRRWWLRIPKRLVAHTVISSMRHERQRCLLQFRHVLCVSQAVKQELMNQLGLPEERTRVIYNGIDLNQFAPLPRELLLSKERFSLLYAGSLGPHKGVHTCIEAMALLKDYSEMDNCTLTIVGSGHTDYETHLHNLVAKYDLGERIQFAGRKTRAEMPQLLRQFDVLLFPSMWQEPLARMMQEAMATGLVVVGTTTGGSKELLVENQTGLTFQPGDAAQLACQLMRLSHEAGLYARLSQASRAAVMERFDIERMVSDVEKFLSTICSSTCG